MRYRLKKTWILCLSLLLLQVLPWTAPRQAAAAAQNRVILIPAKQVGNAYVRNQPFTWETKTIRKKAALVQAGYTNLMLSGGEGYLRFRAPETKVYTFAVSGIYGKKKGNGFLMLQVKDTKTPRISYLSSIKTNNGKKKTMRFKVAKGQQPAVIYASWLAVVQQLRGTGNGRIKLKKGQEMYLYLYSDTGRATGQILIS